jgi:hypothetical protein
MSRRKNSMSKVKLVKKINTLDQIEMMKLPTETGIMGAAFRINYYEIQDNLRMRYESTCSKCIQPIERFLGLPQKYEIGCNEDEIKELSNSAAVLTHRIFNNNIPETMVMHNCDLKMSCDVLFNIVMCYVFSKDEIIDFCNKNKDGRVGLLVMFDVTYDLETGEFGTKLKVQSRMDFEQWLSESTDLVSDVNSIILKG